MASRTRTGGRAPRTPAVRPPAPTVLPLSPVWHSTPHPNTERVADPATRVAISDAVDRGPVSSNLPTFAESRNPGAPRMMEGKEKGEEHRDCLTPPIMYTQGYTQITARQELANTAHPGRVLRGLDSFVQWPPTRRCLTHQPCDPIPGMWAPCSSASGRHRRACPIRRRLYPPRDRTPTPR